MLRKYLAALLCLSCAIAMATGGLAGAAEPEETFGNNLSVPTVFAEGYGVTGFPIDTDNGLRGDPAEPSLIAESSDYPGYYLQRTENTWQAVTSDGSSELVTVTVDWSDNLQARSWRTDSVIRIEHVLSAPASEDATAYAMFYLDGQGIEEIWGTDGTATRTADQCAYTVCARLKIERLDARGGDVVGSRAIYDSAIYERFGVDGQSDAYSAEINVPGRLIYGSMWHLDELEMADIGLPADYPKEGWYRITFSLDPAADYDIAGEEGAPVLSVSAPCNVSLGGVDASDAPALDSQSGPLLRIAADGTWTSIDIQVAKSPGGGGGGGKGGRAIR